MPKAPPHRRRRRTLQPPATGQFEYYDTHLPAFGLRVSYSGTKAWFVMTRVDGKLTRITLGRYPALSLAEAREKARSVIEQAKAGSDPRQLEAEERQRKEKERRNHFRAGRRPVHGPLRRTGTAAEYRPGVPAHPARPGHARRGARARSPRSQSRTFSICCTGSRSAAHPRPLTAPWPTCPSSSTGASNRT